MTIVGLVPKCVSAVQATAYSTDYSITHMDVFLLKSPEAALYSVIALFYYHTLLTPQSTDKWGSKQMVPFLFCPTDAIETFASLGMNHCIK